MDNSRILLVDDDPTIQRTVVAALDTEGLTSTVAATGESGFFLASSRAFDLLILDRMLPDRNGLEVLRALRQNGSTLPVLVLTARDSVADRVEGLDSGADDYLPKPFEFPELLARVRALLRRSGGGLTQQLTLADLSIDTSARSARRGGTHLELTGREFELLAYLVCRKGTVVSRQMLARDVWKEPFRGTPLDGVIDVHMARLRKKLELGSAVRLIHTVRGVGYLAREGEP
jgi:DNA-binding response OmpR family regulator